MADVLADRAGLLSIDNSNSGNAASGDNQLSLNTSTKELINKQNEFELSRVTKFIKQDGFITLFGNYPQNSVDIPKFDLSSINVVNDKDVTFNFILCIKDGVNSEPQLYATSKFYELLVSTYNDNNPIPVNYLIHQRKVVVIDIEPILEKVERLREDELSIGDEDFIKVFRNLFVISNYEELESGRIVANSTYNIIELLKYISWVVSKPNPNYDDRLLPTNIIGEWGDERQLDIYNVDEPSLLNSISLIQPNDGGIVQL
jgi:hypothetical protein